MGRQKNHGGQVNDNRLRLWVGAILTLLLFAFVAGFVWYWWPL